MLVEFISAITSSFLFVFVVTFYHRCGSSAVTSRRGCRYARSTTTGRRCAALLCPLAVRTRALSSLGASLRESPHIRHYTSLRLNESHRSTTMLLLALVCLSLVLVPTFFFFSCTPPHLPMILFPRRSLYSCPLISFPGRWQLFAYYIIQPLDKTDRTQPRP